MAEVNPTKVCVHCNQPFEVKTHNREHAKYCSLACRKAVRAATAKIGGSQRVDAVCQNCGKAFQFYPSQSPGKFCCRACKHAAWSKPSADRGFADITGQTFGRWTVLSFACRKGSHLFWNVRCSCAAQTEKVVSGHGLKKGASQSCGCIAREGEPRPDTKACTKCGKEFPFTDEFFHAKRSKESGFRWGLTPWCHECYRPIARKRHDAFRRRLKHEVLSHYSGGGKPRCVCCGLDYSIHFLTLDHINGDGKEDRKIHGLGMVFYARMKKLGYPPHLQTLCWSCNLGRRLNGGICPHKQRESEPGDHRRGDN